MINQRFEEALAGYRRIKKLIKDGKYKEPDSRSTDRSTGKQTDTDRLIKDLLSIGLPDKVIDQLPENCVQTHFEDYWTFIKTLENSKPISSQYESSTKGEFSFTGTHSFQEALDYAKFGWKGSKKIIQKAAVDLKVYENKSFQLYHDTSGSYPDIERAVMGVPEDMIEFTPDDRVKRILDVWVEGNFLCDVNPREVTEFGSFIINTIDAIEANDYQCNVKAVFHSKADSSDNSPITFISVDLKNPGYSVNQNVMAFALCHASFFRRLIFRIRESDEQQFRRYLKHTCAYGRSSGLDLTNLCDLYFPGIEGGQMKIYQEKMIERLSAFGVKLEVPND